MDLFHGVAPYFLGPIALFFMWAISQENPYITADCKATSRIQINKCVEMLRELAPISFVSEKLCLKFTEYLQHLNEEISLSQTGTTDLTNPSTSSKKRPFSEVMAKKVEVPSVSNFLYSQHSSPINLNSQISPSITQQSDLNLNHLTHLMTRAATNPLQFSDWNVDLNLFATQTVSSQSKTPNDTVNQVNQSNTINRLTSNPTFPSENLSFPIGNLPNHQRHDHADNPSLSASSSLVNPMPLTDLPQGSNLSGTNIHEMNQTSLRVSNDNQGLMNQTSFMEPSPLGTFESGNLPSSISSATSTASNRSQFRLPIIQDRRSHYPIDPTTSSHNGNSSADLLNLDHNYQHAIGNAVLGADHHSNEPHAVSNNFVLESCDNRPSSHNFSFDSADPLPMRPSNPYLPQRLNPSQQSHVPQPSTSMLNSHQLPTLPLPPQPRSQLTTLDQAPYNVLNSAVPRGFEFKAPTMRSSTLLNNVSSSNFGNNLGIIPILQPDVLDQSLPSNFTPTPFNSISRQLADSSLAQQPVPFDSSHLTINNHASSPSKNNESLPPSTGSFPYLDLNPLPSHDNYISPSNSVAQERQLNPTPQKTLFDLNPHLVDLNSLDNRGQFASNSINPLDPLMGLQTHTTSGFQVGQLGNSGVRIGVGAGASIPTAEPDVNEIFSSICDTWLF